ncbi:hypothetical protein [Marinivivus vitaminiproducens]|uniref:hypothetical protein n=1 Tax=Marinivivus vitaminiproducens TaxID=3035935 RepID=UPI0027A33C54|nr:hypothetical protein P4R82_01945 [Geminicoccaceae bacterium SCSIO 64248]
MADMNQPAETDAANAPTDDAAGDVAQARRLVDRYLEALGFAHGERRRLALTVLRQARARDAQRLPDAAFAVLVELAGIGATAGASGEDGGETPMPSATPPERHAPMPEHDLVAAWRRPAVGATEPGPA